MRVVLIRATAVMPDPPVEKMANTLCSQGHEVTIVAWDRGEAYSQRVSVKQLSDHRVKIVHFGIPAQYSGGLRKNFIGLLLFQYRIAKWLWQNRDQFDAVHAFDFDTGFTAMVAAEMLGKRLIYHVLDYYVEGHVLPGRLLNALVEFCEIRVLNTADAVIVCTDKRIEQIRKASPQKVYVIHNTPEKHLLQRGSIKLKGCPGKVKIVYVGILADFRMLLETIHAIAGMDNAELHIGGFGHLEEKIKEASQKYDNIFYYGKLPYKETLALEAQCDMMIALYDPSFRNHQYAAPNKFYEALMLGKPIIMAENTGFDEVIIRHDIGEITEFSENGFKNAFARLLDRQGNWQEMAKRSCSLYDEAFSWAIMEKRISEMYAFADHRME